ncbi:ABC transporter ATP-binding protein [Streptomonospora nanhaiensis]|uniref:Branched-chain amino acid transport system ATP-binding protein n=1 Tax=Streptomonospora nanhaiensis TaxID=1323731 RepID=A0A853BHQ9_9ACTN|nr:ABC transporter ATP-binding protein [Streptomonospora nanhaiensis]MBV2366379.1 ABC transporter ATP-binding protein [Streptomonospora nanhaiensis]MBX9388979.1 ABC transporter ATP-binding protein [Streptomonospora nanhaiensis]NYI94107.1 branched-chain amino acid transport system ATP-binding protein [Streptomonospora nanhaiensis]
MPDEPILSIEELTAGYGAVTALDRVTMRIPRGSICAVLGANGAGKTTLLRTVSGLKRAASGRVLLDGADVTRLGAEHHVRHGLVHVPEGGGVIVELTVEENLRLGGLWRPGRRERAERREEVLELFPRLRERLTAPAATLSGGERQMLALGRALMARPRVLLLDEPSLGLAPMVTRKIMRTLRELRAARGLTVVLVEQNARSALSITDHGFVLNQGAVVVSGTSQRLLADDRMRHAYLGF